jgi:hypothetical protein
MVAPRQLSRKAGFAAALVEAGMTAGKWALEIGEVSRTQLYRTLEDPTQSAPLTAKIDAFITEHVGKTTAQVA